MRAILEILTGPQAGEKIDFPAKGPLTVGRYYDALLVLRRDALMSNLHFSIEFDGQKCLLKDLGSERGTQVNGAPVRSAELGDGDRIHAGETSFIVRLVPSAAPAAKPAEPAPAKSIAPPTPAVSRAPAPKETSAVNAAAKLPVARAEDGSAGIKPAAKSPRAAPPTAPVDSTPPPLPPLEIPKLEPVHESLLTVLRSRVAQPLFALLDAARNPKVLDVLRRSGCPHASLYQGKKQEELGDFAPYLAALEPGSRLLETLAALGWGDSWGVFFTSLEPADKLRKHFRHFLLVELEGKGQVYFRFYDPRVLRLFLPTCTAEELGEFFGPIASFWMEGEEKPSLLRFTLDRGRLRREELRLKEESPKAGAASPAGAGR